MKRLALALAAAALGTGCAGSSSPPPPQYGSVNLYWDFVRYAPAQAAPHTILYDSTFQGSVTGPCTESAVDTVTVDSGVGQVTVDCVNGPMHSQGVAIDGLLAGSNGVRVRGYRGSTLVYDDSFTISVPANAVADHYLDVGAVAAPFALMTNLYNVGSAQFYNTCGPATPPGSASTPDLYFEIREPVFKSLIDKGIVPCGATTDTLPAPILTSSYLLDLDDYKVRVWGEKHEDGTVFFDSCWQDIAHFASGNFTAEADTSPLPTCPAL